MENKINWTLASEPVTEEQREAELAEVLQEDPGFSERIAKIYETLQEITPKKPDVRPSEVDYPIDKISSSIWDALQAADQNGQLEYGIITSNKGDEDNQTVVTLSLIFDKLAEGVGVTNTLTNYDKRLWMGVIAACAVNGGECHLTTVYNAIGNKGRPGSRDLRTMHAEATKMAKTQVFIDATDEYRAGMKYYNGERFVRDGSLLPITRETILDADGNIIDAKIKLTSTPLLLEFATMRRQITTIPQGLFVTGLSKTEATLTLEDYLIERIAKMRRKFYNTPKSKRKESDRTILLETLFDRCGIKSYNQRDRALPKIRKILDTYKATKWDGATYIAGYEIRQKGGSLIVDFPPRRRSK